MTFAWTDGAVPLLRFDAPEGYEVAFSSRLGGTSEGPYASLNLGMKSGDDQARVAANRGRAVRAAGGDPVRATGCFQTHSPDVAEVVEVPAGAFLDPDHPSPRADALVTSSEELTLMALGADCLTVALCVPGERRVAVAHAGWPGLLAGVLENAARAVGRGAVCAIGPGAGPCCYAVRDDVGIPLRERFGDDVVRDGRADLPRCAERALLDAGAASVVGCGLCTICDGERFFSHRRDGSPGGRQAVLARLGTAA